MKPAAKASGKSAGPIVYVVDDDFSVREALTSLIRSIDLDVETFSSAREFLQYRRSEVPACLVLDVRLPTGLGQITVAGVVRRTGPNLMAFVLSFAIVGVYWVGHHLMVRGMRVVPRSALWANNLFLLCITLLPASAAVLGGYPGQRAGAVLYGANLGAVAGSLLLLLNVADRCHRRLGIPQSPRVARLGYSRTASGVGIAGLGIGLAWVSPWASYAVYWLTPGVYVLMQLLPSGGAAASSRTAGGPMTNL